jgi:hypothetical protein
MAFTFTNYAGIAPQHSPLHDMIGQILSGYTDTTKAQFLRPGLEEQLRKAQLENKYYGPNIESQIGLRGAQSGHYGALTRGQNITNQFLPQTLQTENDYKRAQIQQALENAGLIKAQTQGVNIENTWLPRKLQEDLKKQQLYNLYYGPSMESQMGLQGAQAGHYGALTQGENIRNQRLPTKLDLDMAFRQAEIKNQLANLGLTNKQIERATIENKNLPEVLKESLRKQQLENKWYEPKTKQEMDYKRAQIAETLTNMGLTVEKTKGEKITNKHLAKTLEANFGLTKAQTKVALANMGLIEEETKGKKAEREILPAYKEAQIAEAKAKADQLRMQQTIQQQLLGISGEYQGQPGQQGQPGEPGQPLQQGQGMFPLPGQQGLPQQQNMTYPQAAMLMKMSNMGQPKIVDSDGKQIAITPFGNFDTGVQGLTPGEKAFATSLGEQKGKFYTNSVNDYNSYKNQGLALKTLTRAVEENPEFRNVTGRINKPITNWFGTPEQQQLLGTLQSASGEISLQVASSLKGAWTGRDQSMVDNIKAGPNDFPDVFIGKLKAQTLINNVLEERARLQAEYVEQGMSQLKASEKAANETPLEKFEPQIKELTKHKPAITKEEAIAEYQRRQVAGKK